MAIAHCDNNHSEGIMWNPIFCIIVFLPLIFFSGIIYALLMASTSYISWVLPVGYGFLCGIGGWYISRACQFSAAGAIIFAIIIGIFASYSNWVWTFWKITDYGVILNPAKLFEYMDSLAKTRIIYIGFGSNTDLVSHGTPIHGDTLIFFWFVEFIMIISGSITGTMRLKNNSYFCQPCKRWASLKTISPFLLWNGSESELISNIQKNDFSPFFQMETTADITEHYQITIDMCSQCKNGVLQIEKVEMQEKVEERRKSFSTKREVVSTGEIEEKRTVLLKNFPCSKDLLNRLLTYWYKTESHNKN